MNRLELRKTLVESGIQVSSNQIDRAIESLGLPTELQPEHVDKLKAHFQATARPNSNPGNGSKTHPAPASQNPNPESKEETAAGAIAPQQVKANQAQESAAKALNLAVQTKNEGRSEAAQRGATQAIEEVTTEFTAYANVLLQGTEAMTQAKEALWAGLKQATAEDVVAVDFSDFFSLNAPVQGAIEGGN